jgi:hypothetical protein
VGFTTGVIGGSLGVIAGIVALADKNTAASQCVRFQCDQTHGDGPLDSARTWATICNVSFGVGAVGLVVGIIGQLNGNHDKPKPPDPAASIQPWVGPGMVGLHASF